MRQELTRTLNIRLSERAYQSLQEFADLLEIPKGQLIRESINHYLHYHQDLEKKRRGKGGD